MNPDCDPDRTLMAISGNAINTDDDATRMVTWAEEEFTRIVSLTVADQPPSPTLQLGTRSLSISHTATQPMGTRGTSQLRKLAEEAALMHSAPSVHATGATHSSALPAGFDLFEYRIDKVLGQGSFGITYLATDVNLNVQMAIKEYLPRHCATRSEDYSVTLRWPQAEALYLDGLEAFLMEARTLATFRHPNIVGVARFFEAHQTAYMVLEYEEGQSLKQWWAAPHALRESALVEYLQPLLDGLALVHEAGYLHRDIKPDNIYASIDDGRLVLLDFGAARLSASGEHTVADVLTPGYAPIEQHEGGAQGPWTDVYAFGATLYWMISGQKPAPAPARLSGESITRTAVDAGAGRYGKHFLETVDWALQVEASLRPQSVQAFAAALFRDHAGALSLQDALQGHARTLSSLQTSRRLKVVYRLARVLHLSGWPLTIKLIVLMMIAAMGPMLATSYYNLQATNVVVTSNELKKLENVAQSTAGRVAQLIGDTRMFASYLASDVRFSQYLQAPSRLTGEVLQSRLTQLIEQNPDLNLAFLLDREGTALLSNDPDLIARNFNFREYFKEAIAGTPYTSGVIVGSTVGGQGIYFSSPVFDADGKPIGALILRLKGSSISTVLSEVHVGDRSLVPLVVDADGILVNYPDESKLYGSLKVLPAAIARRIVTDQRFRRSTLKNLDMPELADALTQALHPASVSYHSTLSDQDEVAGYAPVKGSSLVIAVSEPNHQFQAPLRNLFINVLYSVIAVGLFFLFMVIGLSRSIVRPVLRITTAIQAIKNGEFDKAKIKMGADRDLDEIGQLSRAFNIMIDVLRQREQSAARSRGKSRKSKG